MIKIFKRREEAYLVAELLTGWRKVKVLHKMISGGNCGQYHKSVFIIKCDNNKYLMDHGYVHKLNHNLKD